jgi:DNA-binding NarL/FixJ family response regulator
LEKAAFRVLVVDDYERWRRFASSTLEENPKLQVIGEASDGLEAVQIAQQLQPDLVLMDIGLPTLNGIEASRQILQSAPKTKILFFSEQRSPDIVKAALHMGATGYVVKSDAANELLPAVEAVLHGQQFVSTGLSDRVFITTDRIESNHYPGFWVGTSISAFLAKVIDATVADFGNIQFSILRLASKPQSI